MQVETGPDQRPRAIVVGSSGGIGRALCDELAQRGYAVTPLARSSGGISGTIGIDLTDERTILAAAQALRNQAPFDMILVASGILASGEVAPEKSLRDVEAEALHRYFAVNAAGPALVAKHFAALLPANRRCVFAALSARVGSISDNRLGGWYGYRTSKAALNMLIRTAAVELARKRPQSICVALHPGTVDTALSKPFQRGVSADRLHSPETSARHLLDVIERLEPADSGRFFAWDGAEIRP